MKRISIIGCCGAGCPERFDWEFLLYVLKFRKTFRARTLALLEKHPHLTVHTFTQPKQLAKHLAQEPGRQPSVANAA